MPMPERKALRDELAPGRALLEKVWQDGQRLYRMDSQRARALASTSLDAVPDAWLLAPGPDELPAPKLGSALVAEAEAVRRRIAAG